MLPFKSGSPRRWLGRIFVVAATHHRSSHRRLPLLLGLLLVLTAQLTVWGGPQEEVSRRDYAIGGFKPPPRWEMLPRDRPSYPQLLAWASRGPLPERAVLTLVGKRLEAGTSLQLFAQEANGLRSRPQLQGLRVQMQSQSGWFSGQRVQVDATLGPEAAGQSRRVLRQLFFINSPFGYVLTLVAPQDQAAARYRDLDDTASNLVPLPTNIAAPEVSSPADAGADLRPS
jgi:hypothetical protein